jgi:hypothetical protein
MSLKYTMLQLHCDTCDAICHDKSVVLYISTSRSMCAVPNMAVLFIMAVWFTVIIIIIIMQALYPFNKLEFIMNQCL